MIKIDLHLHSPFSRQNGDGIKWESMYDSISELIKNDIKIAAFSDHNILDVDFYFEAYELAKTANILILPAIEANVVRSDGKIANIIFVFDNLEKNQLKKISDIARKSLPKRGISLKKCNSIFKDFETIKIPHVGKSDHFKFDDLIQIEYDAIEITNRNHPNYLNVLKKGIINTSVVAFSDTHKWDLYPENENLITIIDKIKEISFKGLKEVFENKKDYTKERISV